MILAKLTYVVEVDGRSVGPTTSIAKQRCIGLDVVLDILLRHLLTALSVRGLRGDHEEHLAIIFTSN